MSRVEETKVEKTIERHWREKHGPANTFSDYTTIGELLDSESAKEKFNAIASEWLAEEYTPNIVGASYLIHPQFPLLDRYLFELDPDHVYFLSEEDKVKNAFEGITRPLIVLSGFRAYDHGQLALEAPIPLLNKNTNFLERIFTFIYLLILANGTISFANLIAEHDWLQDIEAIDWIRIATSEWVSLVTEVVNVALKFFPNVMLSEQLIQLLSILLMTITQFALRPYQILLRRRRLVEERIRDLIFSQSFNFRCLSDRSATPSLLLDEARDILTANSNENYSLEDASESFRATFYPGRAISYHGVSMGFLSAIFYSPQVAEQGPIQQFLSVAMAMIFTLQYLLAVSIKTRLITQALPFVKIVLAFSIMFIIFEITGDDVIRWSAAIGTFVVIEFASLFMERKLERRTVALFRPRIDQEVLSYELTYKYKQTNH